MSADEQQNNFKQKVLIVEDDRFLRELLVHKLTEEGFEIEVAIDGKEALSKIRDWRPALVLLDLIIPLVDGFELLTQIKQDNSLSGIPIIILSNLGQPEEIKKGLDLGAVDYLVKAHLTPAEIIEKIKGVLSR